MRAGHVAAHIWVLGNGWVQLCALSGHLPGNPASNPPSLYLSQTMPCLRHVRQQIVSVYPAAVRVPGGVRAALGGQELMSPHLGTSARLDQRR